MWSKPIPQKHHVVTDFVEKNHSDVVKEITIMWSTAFESREVTPASKALSFFVIVLYLENKTLSTPFQNKIKHQNLIRSKQRKADEELKETLSAFLI